MSNWKKYKKEILAILFCKKVSEYMRDFSIYDKFPKENINKIVDEIITELMEIPINQMHNK